MYGSKFLSKTRIVLVVSILAAPAATLAAVLENIRAATDDERTRVVFEVNEAITYRVFSLSAPERVVIDFEHSSATDLSAPRFTEMKGAPITSLRYAIRDENNLRVVLDLSRKVDVKVMQLGPSGKYGNRLVVDLSEHRSPATLRRTLETDPVTKIKILSDRSVRGSQIHTQDVVKPLLADMSLRVSAAAPTERDSAKAAQSEASGRGSWISAVVATIDDNMATFNPVGRYFRKPIERTIPNLEVSGFIRQSSDMLLAKSGTVGSREQDYRFLQLQNLFQLQADYHLSDGLDVRAVGHFL
jgi:hypothetical protein